VFLPIQRPVERQIRNKNLMALQVFCFGGVGGVFKEKTLGVVIHPVEVLGEILENSRKVKNAGSCIEPIMWLTGDPEPALVIQLEEPLSSIRPDAA
jgi:hypothetical protein